MMNAVLAVPTDSVRESAEIVLREHAFEIDRARTTSTVLTTQPTFRWPTGMDSTGFSRNPGVLLHVTTIARGDSTFLRVAARPVCMVRGKGDSVETSAGGRVVAMTSMLMVVAGISRRHGPR